MPPRRRRPADDSQPSFEALWAAPDVEPERLSLSRDDSAESSDAPVAGGTDDERLRALSPDPLEAVAADQFATIQDPEAFFSTLGATVASQVDDLAYQIAEADPAGKGYLEKVGRLNAAKRQAEDVVLAELVYLTPDRGSRTTRTRTWRTVGRNSTCP